MEQRANLQNVRTIRLTCNHLVIDGLTLDLNMPNAAAEDNKTGNTASASVAEPATAPVQASPLSASQSATAHVEANPASTSPRSTPKAPLIAADHANDGKFHLLLAASGSVASIKIPNIIRGLASHTNLSIRVVLTDSAAQFLQGQSDEQPDLLALARYPNVDGIHRDEDEWKVPWTRGAPILHIELRRWADLLVIAPLSANTLAKVSNGLCDNVVTSVVRAWQVEAVPEGFVAEGEGEGEGRTPGGPGTEEQQRQKRIVVAPAMNTAMWRHPLTAAHLRQLGEFHWFDVLRPVEKTLACGDTGDGAMCDWKVIVARVVQQMEEVRAIS